MLPDLGFHLAKEKTRVFKLTIFDESILKQDTIYGWIIEGIFHPKKSKIEPNLIVISEPITLTIYLKISSHSQANKIFRKLKKEGINVVAHEEQKHKRIKSKEWIIPRQYLSS